MTAEFSESFFLERRAHTRVDFRSAVHFTPDPSRPLRLSRALTQNLSLSGVQVLGSSIPEIKKPFEIWIPLERGEVVHARVKTVWTEIEDTWGDSSYWLRMGFRLLYDNVADRERVADTIALRARQDILQRERSFSKIDYIF